MGNCMTCRGTGKIEHGCTLCGDSTYDHNCNDWTETCKSCGGTGDNPEIATLRARVAELEAIIALTGQPQPDVRTVTTSDGLPEERDAAGLLTDYALAMDALVDAGCDCNNEDPETCLACVCRGALLAERKALDAQRHAAADAVRQRDEARRIIEERDAEIARLREAARILADEGVCPQDNEQGEYWVDLNGEHHPDRETATQASLAIALERAGLMPATKPAKEETR